jgi:asparagine synthase (glutamine-hydrolysing)
MCGICGILDLGHEGRLPDGERIRVAAMLDAMRHRGPDGDARIDRAQASLAVNRLAIRGAGFAQPPLLECEAGVVVACNGEIDNHRELRRMLEQRGHAIPEGTDLAVIAPLYLETGIDFLGHLRGVFALALWDPRCRRLILARDRAGERHLYYSVVEGRVAFASELAALLGGMSGELARDDAGLANYLQSGYCRPSHTVVEGVRKVAPGEVVTIDGTGVHAQPYWRFPEASAARNRPSRAAFDSVFRDAVARQSDVDVDYGVLLSGGVDSALVTAVLRDVRPRNACPAYCIRFGEASFDEGSQAARVARRFGCEFVPVTVVAEDFPRGLRALIAATGELIADPAWIPLSKVAERASRDVRLLLAGEGADELFGGYPTYLGACWASRYARLPGWVRGLSRRLVDAWPVSDKKVAVSFLLKRFVRMAAQDGMARHVAWTASIAPERLRQLGIAPPEVDPVDVESSSLLDLVQRFDFTRSLPEALMAKADRGGMLHGVEIRAPFLDREVIAFAAGLDQRDRVRGLTTKHFLKDYARKYLRAPVVNRRKRGLSVPLSTWLRGSLHDWAKARLGGGDLAGVGIDTNAALALLDEHVRHREDHARPIWTLVVLSEWLEWMRLRDSLPAMAESRAGATCRIPSPGRAAIEEAPALATRDVGGAVAC